MWGRCNKWLRQERIESGLQEGLSRSQSKELRELRRRNRLLEGKRGVTSGGSVFVAGEAAGKRVFPLVTQLALEGISVTLTLKGV